MAQRINIAEYFICMATINAPVKVAVVSDLHERSYDEIIQILIRQEPDLILLPGDTLERHDTNATDITKADIDRWQGTSQLWKMISFIIRRLGLNKKNDAYEKSGNGIMFLQEIAQLSNIIMSVGNHEWYFTDEDRIIIKKNHIHLLDNDFLSIYIKENVIHFGGLSTRFQLDWLNSFVNQNGAKVLLCHNPELYLGKIMPKYGSKIDLIISGHAHGGQIRLFDRGLYAPGLGILSKYCKGLCDNLLVSSGIANTAFFPRINNPSEVCILHITGEKK